MQNQEIYVVVVFFNAEKWIEPCIQSVQSSTTPLKLIAIDNNSSDNSLEILNNYPEVSLIKLTENIGFGRANNVGIKHALSKNANYILLLNQDVTFEPTLIENLLLTPHNSYSVISPIHLNGSGDAIDFMFKKYLPKKLIDTNIIEPNPIKKTYNSAFVNAAFWLVKADAFKQIGGFDPDFFMYAEDENWVDRLKDKGLKIGIVSNLFARHNRKQERLKIQNQGIEQQFATLRHEYLRKIKLPEGNFHIRFFKVLFKLLKLIVRYILTLNIKFLFNYCRLFIYFISSYFRLKKHDFISKNSPFAFLSLKESGNLK